METKEWRFIDKSKWKRGEWDQEPDKMQWQDPATGLPCLIVRGPHGGLCGYVGITKGHRFFGIRYSQCASNCPDNCYQHSPEAVCEVHGGLTFSDMCSENREHGICHVPDPGETDHVWWLGFDCAHSGDLSPSYSQYGLTAFEYGSYKNIEYVKNECASLAQQLNSERATT